MIDLFLSRKARARRHHRLLLSHLDALIRQMDDAEALARRDESISTWSVGEQLEHVAKVDGGIYDAIERLLADSSVGQGGPKNPARIMFLLGFIPRGRGRSPAPYVATGVDADEVRTMLEQRREAWGDFERRLDELVQSGARFPHPALGAFDAAQWLRFAQIHARHHQKIIEDILAS